MSRPHQSVWRSSEQSFPKKEFYFKTERKTLLQFLRFIAATSTLNLQPKACPADFKLPRPHSRNEPIPYSLSFSCWVLFLWRTNKNYFLHLISIEAETLRTWEVLRPLVSCRCRQAVSPSVPGPETLCSGDIWLWALTQDWFSSFFPLCELRMLVGHLWWFQILCWWICWIYQEKVLSFVIVSSFLVQSNEMRWAGIKEAGRGFPGGPVVKNPPSNARDTGLIPCPGRSHMLWGNEARVPQLLSQHSRALEP